MTSSSTTHDTPTPITPLLKSLAYEPQNVSASSIASAFALIFNDSLSTVQMAALLTLLHSTGKDQDPEVLALCSASMRNAASKVDVQAIMRAPAERGGSYRGGLCDIVGTGGDGHSTFNISTTASILASPYLRIAKHGNRASSSSSGSADILENLFLSLTPSLPSSSPTTSPATPTFVSAPTLPSIYASTNYAFLFAPNFHPGMRFAAPIRKQLGLRTIFNLLGPLANPVDGPGKPQLEARVVGVAHQRLGPVFAEALRLSGVRKAMVVCGLEDLDEISCAGETRCWRLEGPKDDSSLEKRDETEKEQGYDVSQTKIIELTLHPTRDFGLPCHPLAEVGGGKLPHENAEILLRILRNEASPDLDPIVDFVLLNVAALLVVAGVAKDWREGVGLGREGISSGRALKMVEGFVRGSEKVRKDGWE
ncbi:MAG: hypothetical protein Q9160_000966 [Pyrenula sp. 1 TL-2023]